ncbi:MAG: Gfo/Idh/MocA family oxidoreductase [Anaerolineae bacterium]|nr:Gfo/Idh/MocA family oxidoreductase [Anaerolineae bacterium]
MSVRVGVVGAGRMGQEHLRRLSNLEVAEVVAVADTNGDLARAQADRYGARAYDDAARMLAQEDLQAVVIATPGRLHREHVDMAAEAGLHILLEKPVAISMEDALAIRDTVRRSGVITAVGYQWRNLDTMGEVREVLRDQSITMANGTWYWTTPLVSWIADKDQGGGQLVDQVTHLFDLMRYLVGEIATVYARYSTRARAGQPGFNNWDASAVAYEFESGAVGVVQATYALFTDCPVPVTLDVVARDLLVRVTSAQVEVHRPRQTRIARAGPGWGLSLDRDFIDAVQTGDRSRVLCDVEEAVRSLAVSLAANQSAEVGLPVRVRDLLA